jgi:hypothetical protein
MSDCAKSASMRSFQEFSGVNKESDDGCCCFCLGCCAKDKNWATMGKSASNVCRIRKAAHRWRCWGAADAVVITSVVVAVSVVPVAFMNGEGLGSGSGSVTTIDVVITTPNGTTANGERRIRCIRSDDDRHRNDVGCCALCESKGFFGRFRAKVLLARVVRQWPYDNGLLVFVVNAAVTTTGHKNNLCHLRWC